MDQKAVAKALQQRQAKQRAKEEPKWVTSEELQLMRLASKGFSDAEIAYQMETSLHHVQHTIFVLLDRFGYTTDRELIYQMTKMKVL